MTLHHIDEAQWHQSIGYARQVCARMFRDGGKPQDAIRAFGLTPSLNNKEDWSKAVEQIAQDLCTKPARRAA